MRRVIKTLAACALTLTLCGCDSQFQAGWERPLSVAGPFVYDGDLIYLNRSARHIVRLEATREGDARPTLSQTRAATSAQPGIAAQSADGSALYVIDARTGTLSIYDLSDDALAKREVELPSVFDRITVDPEGDFLILSFTGELRDDIIARNLNAIALVDLRPAAPTARLLTLSSRGETFEFAPPFSLGGEAQRVVAALSANEVTVLDLLADSEADVLREVPLTLSAADVQREPTRALFDVSVDPRQPDTANLYVLTKAGDDVVQIALRASASGAPKLDLSVNQLAAGQRPVDMALLTLPESGTRLMTIDRSAPRFTLVDTVSGESATFALPMDRAATTLHPYITTRTEGGQEVPERRVLVTGDTALAVVVRPETIALSGDQPTLGRSVEALRLKDKPLQVVLGGEGLNDRAVLFHPGVRGGFSVLNLQTNRDIPIQGYALADVRFDGALAFGLFDSTPNLGVFDLATGQPQVFALPMAGRALVFDARDDLLIVEHGERTGAFTVLDAASPIPARARHWRDVFLTDVLNEGFE